MLTPFEKALKELPDGTNFCHFSHKEISDLCYVCLHELDLHAEGEYFCTLPMRKKYLKFILKHGHYTNEAKQVYAIGLTKTKADFPFYDYQ
jgi:hypothetical protein